MSQYNSPMFSDAVYLFGTTFSPAPSRFDSKEELPDGTRVEQKKLAEQAVLAAFAYLYNKKLIDIVLVEKKILFWKKKMAIVKKLQPSPLDTSLQELKHFRGLEAAIFATIQQDDDGIYDITQDLLWDVSNPWGDILQIVKRSLLHRGILKQVENKNVVNEDISKEEKQVTELKKTLKELQSKGVLYERILSAIAVGISSRKLTGNNIYQFTIFDFNKYR